MSANFINVDRSTPMLLPPDLRDWVPENDLVHFVIDAVETLDLKGFSVNNRGSGSPKYPPAMMLSLLIYSYATGRFSSREIEELTRKAEEADNTPLLDGLTIPDEISRRQNRKKVLEEACNTIKERYEEIHKQKQAEYKEKKS